LFPGIYLKLIRQETLESPEEIVGECIVDWREALFKNSIEKSYLFKDYANNRALQKKVYVQLQWFPYINKDRMLKRQDVQIYFDYGEKWDQQRKKEEEIIRLKKEAEEKEAERKKQEELDRKAAEE
jgi:hypothetical protein